MAEIRRCNRCGNLLPSDAPEGTCPACLLQAGLAGGAPAEGDQDWHGMPDTTAEVVSPLSLAATSAPGVLATLAETVADIPRVHLRDTETITGPGPVVRPSSGELPDPSDRVARLQLLGEVARGGMGVIIKGRDSDLGRDLAVKVLLDEHREKPDLIRRFVEEAQISGQLQHPGVVPVYELGTLADHRPYFAMKLVKGRTLAALLAERQVEGYPSVGGGSVRRSDRGTEAPPTGRSERGTEAPAAGRSPGADATGLAVDLPRFLSIFEAVCQTVAYAHVRGVIHRDLKPSNIMVGSFGEVQVMDWGLAKVLPRGGVADDAEEAGRVSHETVIQTGRTGKDAELSQAGSVMGTPAYMPPEQASGDLDRLDERADVFALGSVLCEVLTGQPAFTGRTVGEIHRKAARGDLTDALGRLDACGTDAELAGLARECLACEPEDRPRDAGAVSERLTAYLGHLLAVRGDRDAAIAAYRDALRIEPAHTGAVTNLVTMLRNRGDQDGVIAVLRTAIRTRPDHAWPLEALSAALQAKGDPDGAIDEIREAIRLSPEEQAYHTQLSALLKSLRDSTLPSP